MQKPPTEFLLPTKKELYVIVKRCMQMSGDLPELSEIDENPSVKLINSSEIQSQISESEIKPKIVVNVLKEENLS